MDVSISPANASKTITAMLCLSSALNAFLSKSDVLMPSIVGTQGSENAMKVPQNIIPAIMRIATKLTFDLIDCQTLYSIILPIAAKNKTLMSYKMPAILKKPKQNSTTPVMVPVICMISSFG